VSVSACVSQSISMYVRVCLWTVTHVITSVNAEGSCRRTIKYLEAVLAGVWIVDLSCTFVINASRFGHFTLE